MAKIISRSFWTMVFIVAIGAAGVIYARPDWIVLPPSLKVSALGASDKCINDNPKSYCQPPTDPNRPSFDQWGNEYDYQGNLISTGSCDGDPIDGPNPKCLAPQLSTPAPTIDNQIVNQSFQGK